MCQLTAAHTESTSHVHERCWKAQCRETTPRWADGVTSGFGHSQTVTQSTSKADYAYSHRDAQI